MHLKVAGKPMQFIVELLMSSGYILQRQEIFRDF